MLSRFIFFEWAIKRILSLASPQLRWHDLGSEIYER